MSWSSAIRLLQTAIENVREECSGTEYKDLLSAVDAADRAAEKALGEQDDSAEDKKEEQQPKTLKGARVAARKQFADSRQAAGATK